jgi:hypothetical protein
VLSPPSKKILKGDLKIGFTELALSMRLPQIVAEYVIDVSRGRPKAHHKQYHGADRTGRSTEPAR